MLIRQLNQLNNPPLESQRSFSEVFSLKKLQLKTNFEIAISEKIKAANLILGKQEQDRNKLQ